MPRSLSTVSKVLGCKTLRTTSVDSRHVVERPNTHLVGRSSNASQALDRFDEMQGPLQGLRFVKQSLKLELHVDFARQHPLFVCEHDLGVAFAHSLWRVVELMRTMGWPVEPDAKASTLLVAHGAILGTRTLVRACPSSCRATPSNGRPRVLPSGPGWT